MDDNDGSDDDNTKSKNQCFGGWVVYLNFQISIPSGNAIAQASHKIDETISKLFWNATTCLVFTPKRGVYA